MKFCILAFLTAGRLLADGVIGIGEGMIFNLPSGELTSTNYVVDGQLRKTAAGEQQLEASRLVGRGEVLVTQGTLRLVPGEALSESSWKPMDVLSKAAMWIDVSEADTVQLVEGSSENVYQILDVREPDRTLRDKAGAYAYPHWMAYTNIAHSAVVTELGPDHWFPTYTAAANGEPAFVDFGGYQSGQSLKMYNAKGADSYLSNVRHIFVVAGTFDYKWGFLLNGGNGTYTTYVPQSYSRAEFSASAYFCWLNNNEKQQTFRTGRFRVDNAVVDPFTTKITEGWHLLDMPQLPENRVSGFFSGADIASDANQYRQGGGRLCEVIAFTAPISESERSAIANYLTRKWLGASAGSMVFRVAEGAAAVAEYNVADGARETLTTMGGVTVVKKGAGTVAGEALDGREALVPITTELEAGSVDTAQELAIVGAEARTYAAADGVVTAGAAGSDMLVKTGSGELSVRSLDPAVKKIRVEGGTLRFVRAENLSAGVPTGSLDGVIEDPSFEAFAEYAIKDNATTGELLDPNQAKHGWLATSAADKCHVVRWSYSETDKNYYCRNAIPYPDGQHALVMSYQGAKTTVTLPRAGVYRLVFWAAPRPNYAGGEFRVSIDDAALTQVMTANADNTYVRHEIRTPYIAAGNHTLVFQADPYNKEATRGKEIMAGNKVCMIDDIRVEWLSNDDPGGTVANGDFELNQFQYKETVATNSIESWVVGATSADSHVRLIIDGTAASAARYVAIGGTATLSGIVDFKSAGSYCLVFKMRQPLGTSATDFKSLGVSLGQGGSLFNETVVNTAFGNWQEIKLGPFAITDDAVGSDLPLIFSGTAAGAVVAIDDVRVERTKDSAFRFTDTFASGSGWTVDESDPGLPGVYDSTPKVEFQSVDFSNIAASGYTWGAVPYDDNRRVAIRNRGTIYRTVTFPAAGTYRVSVVSMGRFWRYQDQHLENPAIFRAYGGQSFAVWVGAADGSSTNRLGEFTVDGAERWTRHSFYATVDAGDHRVGFSGLKLSDEEYDGEHTYSHAGMLDGLVIESVALKTSDIPQETDLEIEVCAGAKLGLDDGIRGRKISKLVLGGHRKSGDRDATNGGGYLIGSGSLTSPKSGLTVIVK